MLANIVVFVAVAVAGGLGSAWYMIERGSALTTDANGPWVAWTAAGRADADPYTRAHFARRGALALSSTIALTYEARTDSDGRPLRAACDYVIDGEEPSAAWWSLAVFDEAGALIPNAAGRHAYNSATLMRIPGGSLAVTLARDAAPGNWLPAGNAGRLTLTLTVEEPYGTGPATDAGAGVPLPRIRRLACR